MKLTGNTSQALIYFLSKKWKLLSIVAVLSFFVALFESLSTVAIYPVLSQVIPASEIGSNSYYLDQVNIWIKKCTSFSPLFFSVVLLFLLTLIKIIFGYVNNLFAWIASNQIIQETQAKMMSSLLNSDYQFLVNAQKGDLAYRVLSAPGYIGKVINYIPMTVVEILKIFMMLAVLLIVSPGLTMIILSIAFVYFLVTRAVAKNVSYGTGSGRARSASNQSIHALNALKGIKSIRLHGVTDHWTQLFVNECKSFYNYAFKDTLISSIPSSLFQLIPVVFLGIIVLAFNQKGAGIVNSLPMLGVFVYALLKIMPGLMQISNYAMALASLLPHAEAAYLAVTDADLHQKNMYGTNDLKVFASQIDLKAISFSYINANRPALGHIDLKVKKGEFVGIIGHSGSGKTTLLDLISGLLTPSAGSILIDGKAMASFSPESLSKHIGYVGQETFLFNDSIRNNILFGRSGFNDEKIKESLRKADILEFVESLSTGLDWFLADDGMKISGGQRQRLSIARALLRDPEILLLDEATSALDHIAEANILETILKLVKNEGKTIIFVTHRKSAIQQADRIIEMKDGSIIKIVDQECANASFVSSL